jgi:SAM-dependent methyltransferase
VQSCDLTWIVDRPIADRTSTMTRSPDDPITDRGEPPFDGSHGWDAYAPFYDWENARTLGRRDIEFWRRLADEAAGPVLELGCGTGRVLVPLARAGVSVVGVDRSAPMLDRARRRIRRARGIRAALVRADIRQLPFAERFSLVIAPYGILQSLTRDRDLERALEAVARVTRPGGRLGLDLVPDLTRWKEYRRRVTLRGTIGDAEIALVESVRQDRRRGLTLFDEEYIERRRRTRRVHRFSLTFRTVSVKQMTRRIERVGFRVDAVYGDYSGRPWDARAETWLILATRVER